MIDVRLDCNHAYTLHALSPVAARDLLAYVICCGRPAELSSVDHAFAARDRERLARAERRAASASQSRGKR